MTIYKDLNDFAKEITIAEKGKKQVSIGQVKEILSKINELLSPEINLYDIIKNGLKPTKNPQNVSKNQINDIKTAINLYNMSRKSSQDGIELSSVVKNIIG